MSLKINTILYTFLASFISFSASANFQPLTQFGDNPGELSASYFQSSKSSRSLIVLLHGCVQNGEELALQSGLVGLAKQNNLALLIPQQSGNNNVKSCFNWFSEQDNQKDQGEVLSIKNMVLALKEKKEFKDVYIAGLSAGGAITSALLVHYPELFKGGAVVAGLPYPCANDLAKAISCMRNGPSQSIDELVVSAKVGNKDVVSWPSLLVITGNDDAIVNPKNSRSLALQWANLTKSDANEVKNSLPNYQKSQWVNNNNQAKVQLINIHNIGHGITVNPALNHGGTNSTFLPKSSFDSVTAMLDFWKINGKVVKNQ